MPSLVDYKGFKIVLPVPAGEAGSALNDNFKALADRFFLTVMHIHALGRQNTPPPSPADGDVWIVGTAPVSDWASHANAVALFFAGGWAFIDPSDGWLSYVTSTQTDLYFASGAWQQKSAGAQGYQFGVLYSGTTPDSIDPSRPLPPGWSANFAGAILTIQHNVGRPPSTVTYLGYNAGTYRFRYPTTVSQMSVSEATFDTHFSMSVGTSTTGSASGAHCIVQLLW